MRGKSARGGGAAKSPHVSLSPSSGPMNKYVTQGGDGEGERQTTEKILRDVKWRLRKKRIGRPRIKHY